MRTLKLYLTPDEGLKLTPDSARILGRTGEDRGTVVTVDVSAWDGATYAVNVRRPDGVSWPLIAGATGPIITADVPPEAVEAAGFGAALEVVAVDADGRVIKSAKSTDLSVEASMSVGTAPLPGAADWKDELALEGAALRQQLIDTEDAVGTMIGQAEDTLGELVTEVQGARDDVDGMTRDVAVDKADTHGYMERAEAAAQIAEKGLHVVTLSIDEDGYLVQEMADDKDNITFGVDADGYLEVEING